MSLTTWTCEAGTPSDHPLTVGETFPLSCHGEAVEWKEQAQVYLQLPKNQQFALRLLKKNELSSTRLEAVATSYMVGQHRFEVLRLSDGEHEVALAGIQLQVASVIKQEENPERKPYAPVAPVELGWPVWIWLAAGFLLLSIVGAGLWRWWQAILRRRWQRELADKSTVLSPYLQFNKDLRRLVRQYPLEGRQRWSVQQAADYIRELSESFNWLIARKTTIAAPRLTPSQTLRQLRRRDRVQFDMLERDLKKLLPELQNALRKPEAITNQDAQQLTDLARRVADRLERGP